MTGASQAEVEELLDDFLAALQPRLIYFRLRPRLRDPDDERVLEIAVNGGANAIVTFNARFADAVGGVGVDVLSSQDVLRKRIA